jgi:mono/diheme cytochrome c family protein
MVGSKVLPGLVLILALPLPSPTSQAVAPSASRGASVEHGRYLVEGVSMCFECHTPRDEDGELRRDQWLLGAPVPVASPPYRGVDWAIRAPRIAGMPGYSEGQGIRLLTRGIGRSGGRLRPPMPPFRFSEADARAVVAYLESREVSSEP